MGVTTSSTVAATYEPIATNTFTGSSNYTFNSISQSYTDLIMIFQLNSTNNVDFYLQVGNGSVDTGTNYSLTNLYGNGSSAGTYRLSNQSVITIDNLNLNSTMNTYIIQFMNYSNTSTYKTILSRGSEYYNTNAIVGLWRSTSAINTIKLYASSGSTNFASATLYGIKAA